MLDGVLLTGESAAARGDGHALVVCTLQQRSALRSADGGILRG